MFKTFWTLVYYPNFFSFSFTKSIGSTGVGSIPDKICMDERIRIKKEWTDIFLELFKNINKIQNISIETQGYPLFILKK